MRVDLDETDRTILDILQRNAKTPQVEIARQVGLSAASVNERIHKLERLGVIRGWVVLLDDQKVGHEITAFIEVFIDHPRHEKRFIALAQALDEVQECHHVAGDCSCLVKVKAPDRQTLRTLVLDRFNSLAGVRQTRTTLVLETAKETSRLPLRSSAVPGPAASPPVRHPTTRKARAIP